MATTEIGTGYTTSSKETRKAVACAEAAARVHLERDRTTLYGGICSNCEQLQTCSFPSTTSDTWFCEEYAFARGSNKMPPKAYKVEVVPDAKAGLCMNCENRETCPLSKTEGGIWFCNEYE